MKGSNDNINKIALFNLYCLCYSYTNDIIMRGKNEKNIISRR